jgi:hypothetical protein
MRCAAPTLGELPAGERRALAEAGVTPFVEEVHGPGPKRRRAKPAAV